MTNAINRRRNRESPFVGSPSVVDGLASRVVHVIATVDYISLLNGAGQLVADRRRIGPPRAAGALDLH
jgi:hypothetical protein